MDFDFEVKKPKRVGYKKPKYWVKCLDCRALIGDRVADKYDVCPFCGGANWSDDL